MMRIRVADAAADEKTSVPAEALDDLAGAPPLTLSHRIRPAGGVVVSIAGELDICHAGPAVRYVTQVIDRCRGPVTVDLAALEFCDAGGLGALLRMAGYAEQSGCGFRLVSPRPSLVKIMRITGLDRGLLASPKAAARRPA
jgi:anti-anti-sigma factor